MTFLGDDNHVVRGLLPLLLLALHVEHYIEGLVKTLETFDKILALSGIRKI